MILLVQLLAELSLVAGSQQLSVPTSEKHGPFIRKCCPEGMRRDKRGCVPGGAVLQVPAGYGVVYGKPNCPMYRLTEEDMESVRIFGNGTLLINGDLEEYCQDWSINNRTVTFLCFPPILDESTEAEEEKRLKVYSVGMFLSLPFLLVTFIVYASLKRLKNLHGRCIMTHCLCMILSYACLGLVQNHYYLNDFICILLGYAIQFFFMATFFWLNVMCFDIYWAFSGLRNLTGSVKERERKKLILYSCYAWGVPLLILLITVGMDYSPYIPDNSTFKPSVGVDKCFFQKDEATGIYFYMPMGFVLVMNIILFSITAFRICTLRRETAVLKRGDSRKHDSTNDKERFSLYLKLFLVMGINWVMELISFLAGGPGYIWYIPDFTNTLQGVFIFIIFVWKERVRRLVWAKLTACCGCKVMSNSNRTQWATSTRNTSSLTTNSSGVTSNSIKMAPMPLNESNGIANGTNNGLGNGKSNGTNNGIVSNGTSNASNHGINNDIENNLPSQTIP